MIELLKHKDDDVVKKIHELFQASYQVEADLIGTDNFPPLKRTAQDLSKKITFFYGYWEQGILAGAVELEIQNDHFYICSLVVHPDHFRKGIARQLMDYGFEKFPRPSVFVETATANIPAITLYEKMGFVEQKRWMTEVGIEKLQLKFTAKN